MFPNPQGGAKAPFHLITPKIAISKLSSGIELKAECPTRYLSTLVQHGFWIFYREFRWYFSFSKLFGINIISFQSISLRLRAKRASGILQFISSNQLRNSENVFESRSSGTQFNWKTQWINFISPSSFATCQTKRRAVHVPASKCRKIVWSARLVWIKC